MIDTQEPKNGDFARYVENLSKLPPGQGQIIGPRAPGSQSDEDAQPRREQLKALRKALQERKQQEADTAPGSLFGRSEAKESSTRASPAQAPAAIGGLGRLLGRVSSMLIIAAVVLLGLSLMDDVPWKPDTDLAINLFVGGFITRFVANLIGAKTAKT